MPHNDTITVTEVGPRDGLQYERDFFPTDKKIELINLLSETGLKKIEVTSFVHPKVIPQLADSIEVINGIKRREGIIYSAIVPNIKGCERALTTPIDKLAMFVSASETHNRKNVNMSVAESLNALREVARMASEAGRSLRGYIVTAFGCPYEGQISLEQIKKILDAYGEMGVGEVSLGDTTGMANPRQVTRMAEWVLKEATHMAVAFHFHNSRGSGLANALAAYDAGIRIFDSSVGGIGGCPTAIGAYGNICTEDLVNMMEEMEVPTGVDFEKIVRATALAQEVLNTEMPSYTLKQGRPEWK